MLLSLMVLPEESARNCLRGICRRVTLSEESARNRLRDISQGSLPEGERLELPEEGNIFIV